MIYDKLPVVFLSALAAEKKDSTNKIIAEYILAHQDEIQDLSIKELASLCHVGTGSLSRFVSLWYVFSILSAHSMLSERFMNLALLRCDGDWR